MTLGHNVRASTHVAYAFFVGDACIFFAGDALPPPPTCRGVFGAIDHKLEDFFGVCQTFLPEPQFKPE